MKFKKITLTYLYSYLAVGGLGFSFFPKLTLELFFSNGEYDQIMVRLVGMFMLALAFLIYQMVRRSDWTYYTSTIAVRTAIVLFLIWIYYSSRDPLFLILLAIVLIGLVPSYVVWWRDR